MIDAKPYGGMVIDCGTDENVSYTVVQFNHWNERETYIRAVMAEDSQSVEFTRGNDNILTVYDI